MQRKNAKIASVAYFKRVYYRLSVGGGGKCFFGTVFKNIYKVPKTYYSLGQHMFHRMRSEEMIYVYMCGTKCGADKTMVTSHKKFFKISFLKYYIVYIYNW